jgi:Ser/Thr protein kinase RdoA (MazF antagonist)
MQQLGPPLGRGRTADVFACEGGALKLFRRGWPRAHVAREAQSARLARDLGLPTPPLRDEVEIDGRQGLLYDAVAGPTLLRRLAERPWTVASAARCLAAVQTTLHECSVSALPSYRAGLERDVCAAAVPDDLRAGALRALEGLADGDRLCHGDLHPGNVLLTDRGPLVIDWFDAGRGHPLADVARTLVLLEASLPPAPSPWLRLGQGLFRRAYHRAYSQMRRPDAGQLRLWQGVSAVARLSAGLVHERAALLRIATGALAVAS